MLAMFFGLWYYSNTRICFSIVWTWTWAIDKCVKPVLFALFLFKYIGYRSSDFLHVAVRVRAQEPIKRRTLDSWFNELWIVFSIPLFTCTWNRLYLMFHSISFYSIDSLKEIIDLLDLIVFLWIAQYAWSEPDPKTLAGLPIGGPWNGIFFSDFQFLGSTQMYSFINRKLMILSAVLVSRSGNDSPTREIPHCSRSPPTTLTRPHNWILGFLWPTFSWFLLMSHRFLEHGISLPVSSRTNSILSQACTQRASSRLVSDWVSFRGVSLRRRLIPTT